MARAGALVQWFREQELLRGPYLFIDCWANVLGLEGITPETHVTDGLVDPQRLRALARLRLERGLDVLGDIPEIISRKAEERLVEEPWTYWRYPLGAASRREPMVYQPLTPAAPPPAADPELQIKAPRADGRDPRAAPG